MRVLAIGRSKRRHHATRLSCFSAAVAHDTVSVDESTGKDSNTNNYAEPLRLKSCLSAPVEEREFSEKHLPMSSSSKFQTAAVRKTTFGYVRTRNYEVVLGDHPECADGGPPLSLGWRYYEETTTSLPNLLDSDKENEDCTNRAHGVSKMMPGDRRLRLRCAGYSEFEFRRAIESAQVIRKNRLESRNDRIFQKEAGTRLQRLARYLKNGVSLLFIDYSNVHSVFPMII